MIPILAIGILIQSNSCSVLDRGGDAPGGVEYRQIRNRNGSNDAQRSAAFNSYPVEVQIEIYLFAMINRAPADPVFREYLAVNGANKVPKLVEAIETKTSPIARDTLIGAIWLIDRNCDCVAQDSSILNRLKRAELEPEPTDDQGDLLAKKNYSWALFELERKSPDKSRNPGNYNKPNPYSNTNVNQIH
ncbi:MAG: hypothetical protein AB7N31_17440 [Pyrinomonadaceae bacterium]